MSVIPNWQITADWFDNCSRAVACPCTFAQTPDNGVCESVLFWHIRRGHFGDIRLDDLSFARRRGPSRGVRPFSETVYDPGNAVRWSRRRGLHRLDAPAPSAASANLLLSASRWRANGDVSGARTFAVALIAVIVTMMNAGLSRRMQLYLWQKIIHRLLPKPSSYSTLPQI